MSFTIEITPSVLLTIREGVAYCENEHIEMLANSMLEKLSREEHISHPDAARAYAIAMHFGSSELLFNGRPVGSAQDEP